MQGCDLGEFARAERRSRLRHLVAVAASVIVACSLAAVPAAEGKNLFTLDQDADSGAQIVVDSAGSGYVAWLRHGAPDLVMFCKVPARGRCANALNLPLPSTSMTTGQPDQPVAVLGASNQVWVVAPRSALGDVVYWLSSNGGQSFGAPVDLTVGGAFAGGDRVDDILLDPLEPSINESPPVAYFDMASSGPGLGYSWVPSNLMAGGVNSFSFANPGTGTIANATLGEQEDGYPLEAYSDLGTGALGSPDFVYSFRQTVASRSASAQASAWTSSPQLVGPGYLPALTSGPSGLFLAYEAYGTETLTGTPSVLYVLPYEQATGDFGTGLSLADDQQRNTSLGAGGTIDENAKTGELGVVWPRFGGGGTVMRLWTSTDRGVTFSRPRKIAAVGSGYTGTAALAINAKGGGFITFRTASGLHVANLAPLPKASKKHRHSS